MNPRVHRVATVAALRLCQVLMCLGLLQNAWAEDGPPTAAATATSAAAVPGILALLNSAGRPIHGRGADASVGLSDELLVQMNLDASQVNAGQYVLFFNHAEVKGLDPPAYDGVHHALAFLLKRNEKNRELWSTLLGSATSTHVPVAVSLGLRSPDGQSVSQPSIVGSDTTGTFNLQVISGMRLAAALLVIGIVMFMVWGHARRSSTLRDNLLPQIDPARQPYSLARWQMAFWFTLVFGCFIFLFLLLWDADTVSTQALSLMGISGATALAAVAVDVIKFSPADAACQGLIALGLNCYGDVLRVRQEIVARQAELVDTPVPPEQRARQLQGEILDRQLILQTYDDKTRPFVSEGWFKDITSDLNGPALHRLQVFCWTWVLGGVFLIGVYRNLAMPDFNATLLGLLGISSAGYIGFKYPEQNN